jgi:hypothetical protein
VDYLAAAGLYRGLVLGNDPHDLDGRRPEETLKTTKIRMISTSRAYKFVTIDILDFQ